MVLILYISLQMSLYTGIHIVIPKASKVREVGAVGELLCVCVYVCVCVFVCVCV